MTVNRKNMQLGQANENLKNANSAVEQKRMEADQKRQIAEDAVRAANDQNLRLVRAEGDMMEILEGRLRHVPELQDVREQILGTAVKNLNESAGLMVHLQERNVMWEPKDQQNNFRTLARASQRMGELCLSENRIGDAMEQFRRMDCARRTARIGQPG